MTISKRSRRWQWILALVFALPASAPAAEPDSEVRSRAPASPESMRQARPPVALPADTVQRMGPAPTNVMLTVVTATSIQIEWAPAPGAVRYFIGRDGAGDVKIEANAGFFQPQRNRFVYTDLGRQPAMLHTYSVTAQFNPPLAPSRSAPVQIVTPHAAPPRNFRASVSGANAVTVSWTPAVEAGGGYRIIRNGGNQPAAAFAAMGTTYIDQNVPAGEYSYAIFSVMRLASGEEISGEISEPVFIKARPFNIVALGDSVMWGQGLRPENKFATRVRDWARTTLGKEVILHLDGIAHSGAITFPLPGEDPHDHAYYPGEVPNIYPSIKRQIDQLAPSKVPPNEVDLVLVDGCINNVKVTSIINPFTSESGLRDATRGYCNAGMQNILSAIAGKFPYAKVVVNGYFPIVSRQSDMTSLVALWTGLGVVSGALIPPDPVVGGAVLAGYRERAAALSDLFFSESTSSLQLAVNSVNSSVGGNRFRFASVPFQPENSYAGPQSLLWLIPVRGVAEDEAFNSRSRDCQTNQATDLLCYGAAMGHPNVAGARTYANAITSVAAQFVPEWRSVHVSAGPAREDPMMVRVQPGPTEPGGGSFVVSASDGAAGALLPGSLVVDGRLAGALGTPVRYAFRDSNPSELLVTVDVAGRRPRSFTVPIRKQSVAVAVTSSGSPRTAVVTATDALTGQRLSGTVTVHTPASPVTGATDQALTYPSCGQTTQGAQLSKVSIAPGLLPCSGFVRVARYPDASFEDVPGAVRYTLTLDKPGIQGLQKAP